MFLLDFCGNNMAQIGKNENKSIREHISPTLYIYVSTIYHACAYTETVEKFSCTCIYHSSIEENLPYITQKGKTTVVAIFSFKRELLYIAGLRFLSCMTVLSATCIVFAVFALKMVSYMYSCCYNYQYKCISSYFHTNIMKASISKQNLS